MLHTGSVDARLLTEQGDFTGQTRVSWATGRFVLEPSTGDHPSGDRPADDTLWMLPGIVDTHVHAAWHAFNAEERDTTSPHERQTLTRAALRATLESGVTSVRDAGGLVPDEYEAIPAEERPRVQTSVVMIDRLAAQRAGGAVRAAANALDAGARWIKLVATAGVSAPPETDLAPVFTTSEIAEITALATQAHAGVMVHAWGGEAIDQAIDAGATSIEHGIYLTPQQAVRAAERNLVFVPTLRIYRLVQQMIADGDLPVAFRRRVDDAVATHPGAVRIARDAGLPIALGSDYGTTAQHGTNRFEFDELVRAGLSPAEALVAATRTGAELLRRATRQPEQLPSGRIEPGEIADALIFCRDPREPGVFTDRDSLLSVILDGHIISPLTRTQ